MPLRFNLFVIVIVAACANAGALTDEPTRFAADRPVDCLHIRLDLKVDLPGKRVDGKAAVEVAALRDVSTITLDAVDFDTHSVTLQRAGQGASAVEYVNDGKTITILLEEPLLAGNSATINIDYAVDHPDDGLHFFGPSKNEPDVPQVVWSQGESITNRYWFPCFDNPNERQTTELIVTTDRKFKVSANGKLVSREEDAAAGTVTVHWLQDKPHPAYLVSLIVGEFHVERDTWRGKPVTYWAHPKYKDWIQRSFRNTRAMLDFFSDKIGVEYPWDRYAQISCHGFGGGMENTSATTLGNRALHDARSILDSDSDGLIAHELAHQWWGDLLTCRDWAHLWLNEGFASYFEALWDEHHLGGDEFVYNMFGKGKRARRGKERPILDRAYDRPGSMFDSRAYPKGAWVLHMLRSRLGDESFWKVLHTYATDFAYQSVETVDLRKTVEKITGRSFERFFYDWLERPGHPEVTVTYQWLAEEQMASISVKQTQESAAFHFPLNIEFRFDEDTPPSSVRCDVTEKQRDLYYPLAEQPTMVRIDPGQTVLMDLKEKKGRDLWKAQLLDDPDVAARARAAAHLAKSKSPRNAKLLAEALATEKYWGVQREIAHALGDMGGDVARDALIAGFNLKNHRVRRACVEALEDYRDDSIVLSAVRPLVVDGDKSYGVESAAIETYAALEPSDALDVLTEVLSRESRFETIRRSALTGLGKLRDPAAVELLIAWCAPTKPRLCRPSAVSSLAAITKRMHIEDAVMDRIVEALALCLDDSGRRLRGSAVRAIGKLADPSRARSVLPKLTALAAHETSDRIRRSAEKVVETIKAGKPAQVQVADLREELKEALEKNADLIERLEKIEARLFGDPKTEESKEIAAATRE